MVLEQILDNTRIKKHALFVLFLTFFFVFLAYIVSVFFFGAYVSIAMLFTLTLLLSPALAHLIDLEEEIERKEGVHHFFRNHRNIIKVYFFAFLGVFFGFLVLGFFTDFNITFDYQAHFLKEQQGLTNALIDDYLFHGYVPTLNNFLGLFTENLTVMLITFVLAIFYGAGSMFLIVLNASVFSTFLVFVLNYSSKVIGHAFSTIGVFLIHLLPEISGFFLASIAGSLLSRGIIVEKIHSSNFAHILQDCAVFLFLATLLILLGSYLEVYVSSQLMRMVMM